MNTYSYDINEKLNIPVRGVVSINELLFFIIVLFPFSTMFQRFVPQLNKLILAMFVAGVIWMLIIGCVQKKSIFIFSVWTTMIWMVAIINTSIPALKANVNMALYYIFLMIYIALLVGNFDTYWKIMVKYKSLLTVVCLLFSILLLISVFLPSSYAFEAGSWGDERYFTSFSDSPNRIGPACLLVLTFQIFLAKQREYPKLMLLLSLTSLYTVVMGGSRTYCALGLCFILILYYYTIDNKKVFYVTLIPIILLGAMVVLKSNMMSKFDAVLVETDNNKYFWDSFTNHRTDFWGKQLKLFYDTSILHHFIGAGINYTTYNYGLWAHNDFIEILCSYGYVGLLTYTCTMIYTIVFFLKGSKASWIIKFVVVFIWLFNAFCNFFYCYFCSVLSYPLLLMIVHKDQENGNY